MKKDLQVGIIGGGVAGASVALYLSELGIDVTLFEKTKSLVNGPPICHLHAGGNLYREISDSQCLTLLRESIELIRMYPGAIDFRPTVIAVPKEDASDPLALLPRLKKLQAEYQKLINLDSANSALGSAKSYYQLFSYDALVALKNYAAVSNPQTPQEWMISIAKNIDLEKLKYPLILVREYGINIFRLAASASLWLAELPNARVLTQTKVHSVVAKRDSYLVSYEKEGKSAEKRFDFLINAAGFKSGEIDDMLGFKRSRLVEFKAAYVTQCEAFKGGWPEVIFHGKRGTPNGMAQFTPYPDGYFQLHGMTKNITLFSDGLAKSPKQSAQPKLPSIYLEKIDKGWSSAAVLERSKRAIAHIAQYIPLFQAAKVMDKPLYGAQQIPGEDATLRAADISFEGDRYARCEIVKASSVLNMADAIVKKLIGLGYLAKTSYKKRDFLKYDKIKEADIKEKAEQFAQERSYPTSLANRSFSSHV